MFAGRRLYAAQLTQQTHTESIRALSCKWVDLSVTGSSSRGTEQLTLSDFLYMSHGKHRLCVCVYSTAVFCPLLIATNTDSLATYSFQKQQKLMQQRGKKMHSMTWLTNLKTQQFNTGGSSYACTQHKTHGESRCLPSGAEEKGPWRWGETKL